MRATGILAAILTLQASDFRCSTGGDAFGPGGIRVTGIVLFLEIEGGCWQLRADSGTRYELRPGQAPSSILVDGARVSVVLETRKDLVGVCQTGQIADVERVESVELP